MWPLLILLFPEIVTADDSKFKVYWNAPTFQCDYHKLNFTGLMEKYGIIVNRNDRFRCGDRIAILYDPGDFPAILRNGNELFLRNGGVPQEGNLTLHLDVFQETVETLIPENYDGIGVIDFESWRPIYRQNFGSLQPYKDLSMEIEQNRHPLWNKNRLEQEAIERFEIAGKEYMEETLILAQQLRPNASWGYYAYPYCFNMVPPKNLRKDCPVEVQKENDRIKWLFEISHNLYPSLYLLSENKMSSNQKIQMIQGRIKEAHRVSQYKAKILPYFWYKYQDTKTFVSKEDLYNAFLVLKGSGIDGFVIWGSSNDVNSKKNCYDLFNYIDLHLGPALINT